MRVKDVVVSRWIAAGLLAPSVIIGNTQYFQKKDIERFRQEYIFSDNTIEILGVERLVVQKWARNGRLHPVSGPGIDTCHRYLFRRADVEQLRPENRLTAS